MEIQQSLSKFKRATSLFPFQNIRCNSIKYNREVVNWKNKLRAHRPKGNSSVADRRALENAIRSWFGDEASLQRCAVFFGQGHLNFFLHWLQGALNSHGGLDQDDLEIIIRSINSVAGRLTRAWSQLDEIVSDADTVDFDPEEFEESDDEVTVLPSTASGPLPLPCMIDLTCNEVTPSSSPLAKHLNLSPSSWSGQKEDGEGEGNGDYGDGSNSEGPTEYGSCDEGRDGDFFGGLRSGSGRKRNDNLKVPPMSNKTSKSPKPKGGTLTNFFIKVSTEDWREQECERSRRMEDQDQKEKAWREKKRAIEDGKRRAHKLQQGRARSKRYRDRKRTRKGIQPKKRRDLLSLLPHDGGDPSRQSQANASRPFYKGKGQKPSYAVMLGRKHRGPKASSSKDKKKPVYTNWFAPFLWEVISKDAKACRFNVPFLFQRLRSRQGYFSSIPRTTVYSWINTDKGCFTDAALAAAERGYRQIHNSQGRPSILKNYPELVEKIKDHLVSHRASGVVLNLMTARTILVSHIQIEAPEVFETPIGPSGHFFLCSDDFVRRFLSLKLDFVIRTATKAAQKLPPNYVQLCEENWLRFGFVISTHAIPPELIAGMDQTGIGVVPRLNQTYDKRGSKSVAIVGKEEKRAFSLAIGSSLAGALLPFQAIFSGQTAKSLPSNSSPYFKEATEAGFDFDFSGGSSHFSTLRTMQNYVNRILVPYFEREKKRLGLPATQKTVFLIDVYSVHRGFPFLNWMREYHPNIIVIFIPGGCTGVWQPGDVGIQRPLKHAINQFTLESQIKEMSEALNHCANPSTIKLETGIKHLRDQSVSWIWKAFGKINSPAVVKNAWRRCGVTLATGTTINLSYESLTSRTLLNALIVLPGSNPELYTQLMRNGGGGKQGKWGLNLSDVEDREVPEEENPVSEDLPEDLEYSESHIFSSDASSEVSVEALINTMAGEKIVDLEDEKGKGKGKGRLKEINIHDKLTARGGASVKKCSDSDASPAVHISSSYVDETGDEWIDDDAQVVGSGRKRKLDGPEADLEEIGLGRGKRKRATKNFPGYMVMSSKN